MSGVLGIDPSLTSTGYALMNGGIVTGRILSEDLRGVERLLFIEAAVKKLMDRVASVHGGIDLVVLEGYAMAGKTNRGRLFDIGELGGMIKMLALRRPVEVLLVPPSNLKLYATGNGGSAKPAVVAAVAAEWGQVALKDDEADALVLLKMGEAFLSSRHPRQKHRVRALAGCSVLN